MSVFCSLPCRVDLELWVLRESRDCKVMKWVAVSEDMHANICTRECLQKQTLTLAESFRSKSLKYHFCGFVWNAHFTKQRPTRHDHCLIISNVCQLISPASILPLKKESFLGLDKKIICFYLSFSLSIGSHWQARSSRPPGTKGREGYTT